MLRSFITARTTAALAALLLAASCNEGQPTPALPDSSPARTNAPAPQPAPGASLNAAKLAADPAVEVESDIVYAERDGQSLRLDMARPSVREEGRLMPAVIYVHGGGFVAGDRHGFSRHLKAAVENGFAGIAIDYRLADGTPGKKFPAAVRDVGAAVRWLKSHAESYGIDPERIGLYGGSAGGNLVLMVGLAPERLDGEPNRLYPDVSSKVRAVVNFCGPTDYRLMLENVRRSDPLLVLKYLDGGSRRALKASAREASPLFYVDAGDPPVLIMHGTRDSVVPYRNALRLHEAIRKAGGASRLVPLKDGDHPGLSKVHYRDTLFEETYRFLREELSP